MIITACGSLLWDFRVVTAALLHPDQRGSMAYVSIFRSNVVKIQLLPLYRYHKMTKYRIR